MVLAFQAFDVFVSGLGENSPLGILTPMDSPIALLPRTVLEGEI